MVAPQLKRDPLAGGDSKQRIMWSRGARFARQGFTKQASISIIGGTERHFPGEPLNVGRRLTSGWSWRRPLAAVEFHFVNVHVGRRSSAAVR